MLESLRTADRYHVLGSPGQGSVGLTERFVDRSERLVDLLNEGAGTD